MQNGSPFFYLRQRRRARAAARSGACAGGVEPGLGAERGPGGRLGLGDCFPQDVGARGGQERRFGGGEPEGHGATVRGGAGADPAREQGGDVEA